MDMSVCVLVVLAMLFSGACANFDCGRDLTQCPRCNRADGMCVCDGTHEGYDCSVVTADKTHADCTTAPLPCKNGATCHESSGAAAVTCLCTGNWMGPTCEVRRYEVTCDPVGNTMSLKITPQMPSFGGSIYKLGTEACSLTGTGTYERQDIKFDGDATCGTMATTGTQRTIEVLIQYSPDGVFYRDERVSFTCDELGSVTVTDSGTISHVDNAFVDITESKVPVAGDVSFVMKKSGSVITGGSTVNIGTVIDVEISIANTVDYKGLLIKDCTLSNKVTSSSADANYKSGMLFKDYCEATGLERTAFTDVAGSETQKTFSFRAPYFKGTGPKTLFLTCTVTVCGKVGGCVAATCANPPTGNGWGRRKRAAGDEEKTLNTYVVVRTPTDQQTSQQDVGDKECYQSMEMTAAVVALGVALVIVLVICMFLTVKVILYRKSPSYNEKL